MPEDIGARTEIDAIPSLTIADQQFLFGDSNGKQVMVAGKFNPHVGGNPATAI